MLASRLVAQDSTSTAEFQLIDRLLEHRILSDQGARENRSWVEFKKSLPVPTGEAAQQASLNNRILNDLGLAATAYHRIARLAYIADSLARIGQLPDTSDHSPKAERYRSTAAYLLGAQQYDRPFPPLPAQDLGALRKAETYDNVGTDIRNQRFFIAKVDTTIFHRYTHAGQLGVELFEIGLIDSLLHADAIAFLRCAGTTEVLQLLEQLQQELRNREWNTRSREKQLELVNSLIEKGYMHADTARRMINALGPYDEPDKFDIATKSSLHVIIPCQGKEWTTEDYYTTALQGTGGLVPGLSPYEIAIARTPADTTLVSAHFVVEFGFKNAGSRYSFREYEGRTGVFRRDTGPGECLMVGNMLSALNKALLDAGSDYRLRAFEEHRGDCGDFTMTHQALVFMDPERCASWWPTEKRNTDALGQLHVERPDGRCAQLFSTEFSRDSIGAVVEKLKALGLLDYLDGPTVAKAIDLANRHIPREWDEVLAQFPDLISYPEVHRFPDKDGEVTQGLDQLSRISHGAVRVTEVKEKWIRSEHYRWRVKLSFKVNGQPVRIDRTIMEHRLEDELVTRINHALMEQNVDGRFAPVRSDRKVALLFVDRAQYEELKGGIITRWFGEIWKPELSIFDR